MGWKLDSLTLTSVKESSFQPITDADKKVLDPFRPLHLYDDAARSFALTSHTEDGIDKKPWLHSTLPGGGHRFERVSPDGELVIRKDYLPPEKPDEYHLTLRVSVSNQGAKEKRFGYTLLGSAGLVEPTSSRMWGVEALVATRDNQGSLDLQRQQAAKIVEESKENKKSLSAQANPAMGNKIAFLGLSTKYFACVVVPLDTNHPLDSARARSLADVAGRPIAKAEEQLAAQHGDSIAKQAAVEGVLSEFVVPAGAEVSQDYLVFVGPRDAKLLSANPLYTKAGLEPLVDYTSRLPGAETSARLLTWILEVFHALTRSWGLSIILLTLVTRAVLHPVMVKQLKSSQKMQTLAPEMTKIKAKYEGKDGKMSPENQRRFQAEQWELYKKHGVNPFGCMGPMLLQLPIFYGLYNALGAAYELRHASFLWIRDLSEPDVVARLPFNLPMHGTNALCVLPILMLVVYVFQMKSMPKPADPQAAEQQKIMNWMMPVMGYFFYMVPSGLLLYYITSSTVGMLEQRWIKRQLAHESAQGRQGTPVPTRTGA
jgi:YidC/Oxa1 family membrane protein insertase